MIKNTRGVYTATLTPLHEDLSFNGDLLLKHCKSLLNSGANGIALLGTTGEANSFSMAEKKQMIDVVIEGGIPVDQLMVGTGSCAYTETVELTRYVLEKGVQDILLMPPYFYKVVNDEGLYTYFSTVIDAVANEDLRIYLYHFPKMSGVDMSHALLEKLVKKYPNQIAGMKDSSGDLEHMLSVCRNFPSMGLFAGTEKYLLPVLRAGGAGCISATANATIRKAAAVYQAWQTPEADALHKELTAIRSAFEGLPFSALLKQYLAHQQSNPQWLPVRPPNSPIPETELAKVLAELKRLSFEPDF